MPLPPPRPAPRWPAPGRDRGSISVWLATAGLAMTLLVGLAVDLTGQVYAQQRARGIAVQAARAGGQHVQAGLAIRGLGLTADPAAAATAARTYLAAANVTGTVTITSGDRITVTTRDTYDTKFLGLIGINAMPVTGHGEARITRSLSGVER